MKIVFTVLLMLVVMMSVTALQLSEPTIERLVSKEFSIKRSDIDGNGLRTYFGENQLVIDEQTQNDFLALIQEAYNGTLTTEFTKQIIIERNLGTLKVYNIQAKINSDDIIFHGDGVSVSVAIPSVYDQIRVPRCRNKGGKKRLFGCGTYHVIENVSRGLNEEEIFQVINALEKKLNEQF